ncbi:putative methyltransferase-domain-containing protein [Jimgerdemannia flammicorona]|uniref:Putative methyltransferase-domain-containing protein n=1 Tax=Jimgerdemannia flammicorona TaxID=994334 RepID=A0A433QBF6_9FUNG|nr:putative methyltransferase-domain-containing protein [Jimgerdemannia flammicorona]
MLTRRKVEPIHLPAYAWRSLRVGEAKRAFKVGGEGVKETEMKPRTNSEYDTRVNVILGDVSDHMTTPHTRSCLIINGPTGQAMAANEAQIRDLNKPVDLNILPSNGAPQLFRTHAANADTANFHQDVTNFGLAGKVWDRCARMNEDIESAYALDVYFSNSNDSTLTPANPIPSYCYIDILADTLITEAKPYRILELGSGTGYVGIALANRLRGNCQVYVTDLEDVLPLIRRNVELNCIKAIGQASGNRENNPTEEGNLDCAEIIVKKLHWGESSHATELLQYCGCDFDLVIVSDCVYFPELFSPLRDTLLHVCSAETVLVVGYKQRSLPKEIEFWQDYFGPYFEYEPVRFRTDAVPNQSNVEDLKNEDEENIGLFGAEEGIYVWYARKRKEGDMKKGADATFTTLLFCQMRI